MRSGSTTLLGIFGAVVLMVAFGAVPLAAQVSGSNRLCQESSTADSLLVQRRGVEPTARRMPDLNCIDLFSTARGGNARGLVRLKRVSSPFGVTVTADGHHIHELIAWLDGLPDPSSLGPYTRYVAWATPLELEPVVPLGEVRNGDNSLGRVAFNKYLILISAEGSGSLEARNGPLVLRGRSPSSLMEAHDLLATAPSATQRPSIPRDQTWDRPPGYPDISMLPGLMDLEPQERPVSLAAVSELPAWDELPRAIERQLIELPDGGTFDLEAGVVSREIAGRRFAMLAFNGQHPGPLIKVRERSTIFVNFTNNSPYETAVHWHGIRLDNRFDGVPGVTQDPVLPGGSFRYQIYFPDAGIYWYHPHHREDIQQELGLYGNLFVESLDRDYYGPADRDEVLMLDDILLDEDGLVDFGDGSANYMLMGRFGNVPLVNGEPRYTLAVKDGEVVRFHLTNASNTRTFNISFIANEWYESHLRGVAEPLKEAANGRLPIKVVATDVSKFEREEWAESVVIAPAERYVIEVHFPGKRAGELLSGQESYLLVNQVQGINHRQGVFRPEISMLGEIDVRETEPSRTRSVEFEKLRQNADVIADIDQYRPLFDKTVDHELLLTLETDELPSPIEQSMLYDWIYFNPVEWTGTMPMMNWATTAKEIRWILRDPATGFENEQIDWTFGLDDVVKVRIHNDRSAFHAMQHPIHIHGQRFLVLSQDGVPNDNLAWKDTVLLPVGSTTDILLELSNPGRWMIHCHIAEHLESGMKAVVKVGTQHQ